jgi:hypothetical protein
MLSQSKSHQEVEVHGDVAAPGGTAELDLTACYDVLYWQEIPECPETGESVTDSAAVDAIMRYYAW